MTHYIRVEAVNIYNAIADTNNISIIRGGSLLLKQAIEDIQQTFNEQIEPISTGASIGVFAVKETVEFDKQPIIAFLNTENKYRYFTFAVVDCIDSDYQTAKEILIAKVRILQLQQLSVSADYGKISKAAKPCAVEGIRPAIKKVSIQTEKKFLNAFARIKFAYGKRQRNDLYKQELPNLFNTLKLKFTDSLQNLAADETKGNLHGKIAVIYFDGNGFSGIQNQLVTTDDEQKEFDRKIKGKRRFFLEKLLVDTKGDDWFFSDKKQGKQMRLETLLWGGDEMLFVVPAWKGFELLDLFYDISKDWQITIADKTEPLTHAGGIVFCPHNTPIYKIRELAQQLADGVKNHPDGLGRKGNYFNYLTLESIDYPAEPLDAFFKHKYNKLSEYRSYLNPKVFFDPEPEQPIFLSELELIPKSQAYAMAHLACQLDTETFTKQRERLLAVSENQDKLEKVIKKMTNIFCPQAKTELNIEYEAMMWVHLVELWDYLK